jgi:hypothetical protein
MAIVAAIYYIEIPDFAAKNSFESINYIGESMISEGALSSQYRMFLCVLFSINNTLSNLSQSLHDQI